MFRARRAGADRRPSGIGRALAACLAGFTMMAPAAVAISAVPAHADPVVTPAPAPGTTGLTVNAALEAHATMSVSGTLAGTDGRPLRDKLVSITLDDAMMGDATTASDGTWSTRITLPQTFPVGAHQVVALYLDAGIDGPISATTSLRVGNLPATELTAKASATRVGRHQLLTVSGRLTTTSGRPLPDSAVVVGTPDDTGTTTTAVTEKDGSFVVDYRIHEAAGDQRIPVHFAGDDSGKACAADFSVTVTDQPVPAQPANPSPSASGPIVDSGPGDLQPDTPATLLPGKRLASSSAPGPLTSSTNLAFGGVGLLALLTSLAMLGRSLTPAGPGDERIRLIER